MIFETIKNLPAHLLEAHSKIPFEFNMKGRVRVTGTEETEIYRVVRRYRRRVHGEWVNMYVIQSTTSSEERTVHHALLYSA